MRVILLVDYPNVGKAGNQVEVKDGFARNFLIPKKIAEIAGTKSAKELLAQKNTHQKKIVEEKRLDQESIKLLNGKKLIFRVKVNKQRHPYRAVTLKDIAQKLEIDPKLVKTEPIKKTGIFEVEVGEKSNSAKVTIEIMPEK